MTQILKESNLNRTTHAVKFVEASQLELELARHPTVEK